jgi:hypothetical protein
MRARVAKYAPRTTFHTASPLDFSHLAAKYIASVTRSTKAIGTFCGLVSINDPQKQSPCKELAVVRRFILRKGARAHKPFSTCSVGGRNLDQRFCGMRERGISIPFAHKWLRSTLEQAAETPGEPLFGASNGPTGDPTPVTFLSDPNKLAALRAELQQKLLQIEEFEWRARQDSNLRSSDS